MGFFACQRTCIVVSTLTFLQWQGTKGGRKKQKRDQKAFEVKQTRIRYSGVNLLISDWVLGGWEENCFHISSPTLFRFYMFQFSPKWVVQYPSFHPHSQETWEGGWVGGGGLAKAYDENPELKK